MGRGGTNSSLTMNSVHILASSVSFWVCVLSDSWHREPWYHWYCRHDTFTIIHPWRQMRRTQTNNKPLVCFIHHGHVTWLATPLLTPSWELGAQKTLDTWAEGEKWSLVHWAWFTELDLSPRLLHQRDYRLECCTTETVSSLHGAVCSWWRTVRSRCRQAWLIIFFN